MKSDRTLNPELSARLGRALQQLDQVDPQFKSGRDDERLQQTSKAWKDKCKEIDAMLRELTHIIIQQHQVAIDVGSDGGGRDTRPFLEEMSGKFPKLEFRLQNAKVVAVCNNRGIAQAEISDVNFEWLEQSAVTWMVWLIEQGGA